MRDVVAETVVSTVQAAYRLQFYDLAIWAIEARFGGHVMYTEVLRLSAILTESRVVTDMPVSSHGAKTDRKSHMLPWVAADSGEQLSLGSLTEHGDPAGVSSYNATAWQSVGAANALTAIGRFSSQGLLPGSPVTIPIWCALYIAS